MIDHCESGEERRWPNIYFSSTKTGQQNANSTLVTPSTYHMFQDSGEIPQRFRASVSPLLYTSPDGLIMTATATTAVHTL